MVGPSFNPTRILLWIYFDPLGWCSEFTLSESCACGWACHPSCSKGSLLTGKSAGFSCMVSGSTTLEKLMCRAAPGYLNTNLWNPPQDYIDITKVTKYIYIYISHKINHTIYNAIYMTYEICMVNIVNIPLHAHLLPRPLLVQRPALKFPAPLSSTNSTANGDSSASLENRHA